MDWGWTAIYLIASLLALRFAWRFPARRIAWALVGNIVGCAFLAWLGAPPEATPTINIIAEAVILASCVTCYNCTARVSLAIIVLSLLSMILSFGFAIRADLDLLYAYEEKVNGILGLQCLVVGNVGFLSVVGDWANRRWRWRNLRRPALDAHRRIRLAARRKR